jgi:RimJ/RimL family protein N-acetyltransferase
VTRLVEFDDVYLSESVNWHKDKEIADAIGLWNDSYSDTELKQIAVSWMNDKSVKIYGIEKEGVPAGYIMLKNINYEIGVAEIHLAVGVKQMQNRDVAHSASFEVLKKAFFELGLNCVVAYVFGNDRIKRILDKGWFGFVYEGFLRDRVFKKGKHLGIHVYSVLKNNFKGVKVCLQ